MTKPLDIHIMNVELKGKTEDVITLREQNFLNELEKLLKQYAGKSWVYTYEVLE